VVEAIAVLQALDADARAVARALLFTGMNRPELWENQWGVVFLKGGQPAVEIRGQKTINRKRHIPLFEEKLYLPAISYDVFRKRLRKVDESLAPGSFRKTFSRWMADAGIPKYRRRDYMGHKFGDITERYEMGEVVGWFKADVDAIHKYIADEQKPKKPQQPDMPSLPVFHFIRPKS
jgi:integrase